MHENSRTTLLSGAVQPISGVAEAATHLRKTDLDHHQQFSHAHRNGNAGAQTVAALIPNP